MSFYQRLRNTWSTLGITTKFALSFALFLGLLLIEAVVGLVALNDMRKAESVILTSVEIRQRVFEMNAGLEKARRLHRDFFLQYPNIGFQAAQDLYFTPSTEVIDQVVANSEELKRLIDASSVSATLRERDNDLTLYLSTARRFASTFRELVDKVTQLAAPGTGLESQLSAVEAELGVVAKRSATTLLIYRQMLVNQREYAITRQRPAMQAALNNCFELRNTLMAQGATSTPEWTNTDRALHQYVELARQIPDIDVSIRSKLNDFTLQARAVDPIAANLQFLAKAEVDASRARIAIANRVSTLIIIGTALVGLCFTLLVAAVIHFSITRKVVALTDSAKRMQKGSLSACVEIGSNDEVGVLAGSFNDMSTRMQELVGNLEGLVQQRTHELTEARDNLEKLVAELDDKNRSLEVLSVTDRLTGLANRRKLEAALQSEVLRARRYGKIFSVILLDVDRFKAVNDTFGHPTGDMVLAQLAELLSANSRETDVVGRWGGEEFLIICPETSLDVVAALAERYRAEIERKDFSPVEHVTSSFGVAACHSGDTRDSLLQRVDEALYKAKEQGRNRVVLDETRALH